MNPKKCVHNTTYSVQPPYIPGHSLEVDSPPIRANNVKKDLVIW